MSFVGVIADFASQSIGPRPIDDQRDEQQGLCAADAQAHCSARRHSAGEIEPLGGLAHALPPATPRAQHHSELHDRVARR